MSIESEKAAAINEVTAQFVQAGLSGDALQKAVEHASAGIVVRLNQSGEIVKEYRTYTPHQSPVDYAAAVLQQHGAHIGGTGRTFQQMMR